MFGVDKYVAGGSSGGSKVWTEYANQNNVFGKVDTPKTSSDAVKYLGTFKTTQACFAACNATKGCDDWTFHSPTFPDGDFAGGCYYTVGGTVLQVVCAVVVVLLVCCMYFGVFNTHAHIRAHAHTNTSAHTHAHTHTTHTHTHTHRHVSIFIIILAVLFC